ncbi:MAG: DNA-directed RNA polymerase subunit alpha [Candidatus Omnitrophota bacterium]
MAIKWNDFQMPRTLVCDENMLTDTYGRFIAEPFERGYGVTIGNSLRRVLLSSIEGSAPTSVKIDGVLHEYSTVPGVLEDVSQIILNIKKLILRTHGKTAKKVYIKKEKEGEVQAKDIIADETVEILNPNLHIATLGKTAKLYMEIEIEKGRGYVPAERIKKEGQPIAVICLDATFTPVKKVSFEVKNTRVGQITDYDKLVIDIHTNGSMSPKDAILYAGNILQKHLDIFANFGKLPEEEEVVVEEIDSGLLEKLKTPVSELELSVRSANCLKDARIKTIGDMVKKTEMEMLKYRNFGRKSLAEINIILQGMKLSFGMKIDLGKKK